ncbi:MAG TPA: protein kinase, partial [Thermoanaerobaculia bacterium]|nr:protein kinase [Thermoanaerobaculia bacterium]
RGRPGRGPPRERGEGPRGGGAGTAREARRLVGEAAREIAAAPAAWAAVVNRARAEFGRPPLAAEAVSALGFPILSAVDDGRPALLPLERLEPLGKGGMNTVSRSADLFTGRPLVVRRLIPAESAIEEEMRRRRNELVRERLSVLRRHPVLQRFWGSGLVEGEACELFDFAPGTTLAQHVREKGLTYGALLDVGWHAARGLLHLSRHGLVHGDVKPENFCVEVRGSGGSARLRVSLIDFDIVSTVDEQLFQYRLSNTLDGTLPYMPPENFVQAVPEDPDECRRMVLAKDVFALGMSLVRVVNGRFPDGVYTSMTSLVQKKERLEEMPVSLPASLPAELRELVLAMCRTEWRMRPPLPVVVRTFDVLRRGATEEERARLVAAPRVEALPEAPRSEPVELVGPYRLVNRAFAERTPGDGQTRPLAELHDPFGRRLVGVPYEFRTAEEESAFYEERKALLEDLNAVRLRHPELFPGSFRDLVRQGIGEDLFVVWVVRPLLEGAIDLDRYLREERPDAPLGERIAILRRIAEALSALESGGYTLAALTPRLVFFVPPPASGGDAAPTTAGRTRPVAALFDIGEPAAGRRFRQELMGTASAVRSSPEATGRVVAGFFDVASRMRVLTELDRDGRDAFLQLGDAQSWAERADLLRWLETRLR